MFRLSRLATLLLIGASACGGDTVVNPPPSRVSIALVSGNDQAGLTGSALSEPLIVAVTDSKGPVVGRAVQWSVTSGNGSLSATTVSTDAMGHASVTWTLGGDRGDQAVLASVGNLGIPFHAMASPAPRPIILHFDGVSWSPSLQSASVGLGTVWVASESQAFAAGFGCSFAGNSLMLVYAGTSWSFTTPCEYPYASQVVSISGTAPNDVFAAKRAGLISNHTDVLHYDGQSWNTVYTFADNQERLDLHAIASRVGNDVMAVGDKGSIVHYDGANWNLQTSGTTSNLRAVWGDPATPAFFAVGDGGTILYYDGSAWHAQTSGATVPLYAVWGTSASNVYAAGASGTILHYDGTSWSAQTSGSTQTLRGIWASSASSVFAVGDSSTILRYDGTRWAAQNAGVSINLAAISGSSGTNVFAVGASIP